MPAHCHQRERTRSGLCPCRAGVACDPTWPLKQKGGLLLPVGLLTSVYGHMIKYRAPWLGDVFHSFTQRSSTAKFSQASDTTLCAAGAVQYLVDPAAARAAEMDERESVAAYLTHAEQERRSRTLRGVEQDNQRGQTQ